MRNRRTGSLAVAITIGCSAVLAGCAPSEGAACPSWAWFPTAQERYDEAAAVVTTESLAPSGTEPIFQVDANAYDVEVDTVEKGGLEAGSTIRVVSMPDGCGTAYLEADPMSGSQDLRLYLRNMEGQWVTITPSDGVEVLDR
ncbi:hypothetical protein C5B94_09010 [Clavibacter michiganensis]|uniref:hypothetical protein n=1 Tax=Clavibacter michiganensis TaxID=28447 RepID=UPI000CE8903E|nr:hypothetical protein [Clavibacter michiganensis]PPF53898.1 hypothetical protein C5B94_09010 [Clavibacter michiganensis]